MSRRIVHADDSPSVRCWVAEQLRGLDVELISVADGAAALEALRNSPCDLLLTDLEMPELDGLDLTAAVRKLPKRRFLPILVLSSRHPAEIDPARRRDVTGWIVKPIDPEHFRRWVRRALAR